MVFLAMNKFYCILQTNRSFKEKNILDYNISQTEVLWLKLFQWILQKKNSLLGETQNHLPLYSPVYSRVFHCIPLYSPVLHCISLYSHVFSCISILIFQIQFQKLLSISQIMIRIFRSLEAVKVTYMWLSCQKCLTLQMNE